MLILDFKTCFQIAKYPTFDVPQRSARNWVSTQTLVILMLTRLNTQTTWEATSKASNYRTNFYRISFSSSFDIPTKFRCPATRLRSSFQRDCSDKYSIVSIAAAASLSLGFWAASSMLEAADSVNIPIRFKALKAFLLVPNSNLMLP